MGDEGGLETVAEHRCDEGCVHPVRCILCHRIKRPQGTLVPAHLAGMRCDERCAGYLIDPPPGHLWPTFLTAGDVPAWTLEPSDPVQLLAWALHQAHPPVGIRTPRPAR